MNKIKPSGNTKSLKNLDTTVYFQADYTRVKPKIMPNSQCKRLA